MDIVKWGEIAFYVSPTAVRGVRDINISSSCKTYDSTENKEGHVKWEYSNGYEVSMKAILNVYLGEDVQTTAIKLTEAARLGTTGYLYCGGTKLFPCIFLMASASIGNVQIAPNGTWTHCEVQMTLKQSSKFEQEPAVQKTESEAAETVEAGNTGTKKKSTKVTDPYEYDTGGWLSRTVKKIKDDPEGAKAAIKALGEKTEVVEKAEDAEKVVNAAKLVGSTVKNTSTTKSTATTPNNIVNLASKLSNLPGGLNTEAKISSFTKAKSTTTDNKTVTVVTVKNSR